VKAQPCVVVGVDASPQSEAALDAALALAARLAGRVVVVHAAGLLEEGGYRDAPDLAAIVTRARERRTDADRTPVDVVVEDGSAADVLVRIAGRLGADLIVVGSRGLGAAIRPLGSVSEAVVGTSPVPVLVLPHGVLPAPGPSPLANDGSAPESRGMRTDRLGITVLETNTCWELLRSAEVGRLAVSISDHPDIFPVNFAVDRGTIVFRTAEGTKLAAAVLGRAVAFEVDGYDAEAGDAWSVVVKGRAVELERMQDVFDALDLPLFPWHAAPKHRFVRIEPDEVSGRRFHVVDKRVWGVGEAAVRSSPE
jgi:uncharacterized protein